MMVRSPNGSPPLYFKQGSSCSIKEYNMEWSNSTRERRKCGDEKQRIPFTILFHSKLKDKVG